MKVDTMTSMNVSLPESMRRFIEDQIATGGYGTVSEYFRELVRADKQRKAEDELAALLLQGIKSGKATPMTNQDWTEIRAEVRRRAAARQTRRGKK